MPMLIFFKAFTFAVASKRRLKLLVALVPANGVLILRLLHKKSTFVLHRMVSYETRREQVHFGVNFFSFLNSKIWEVNFHLSVQEEWRFR